MGIHDNTTTNKDQYRRAPLNGLIIGTIVGVVWPTVFGILHVRETLVLVPKAYPPYLPCRSFSLWLGGSQAYGNGRCTRAMTRRNGYSKPKS